MHSIHAPIEMPCTPVALDPADIAEGTASLVSEWPVSLEESLGVYRSVAESYASLARSYETVEPDIAGLLSMSMPIVAITETISLYNALATIRRFSLSERTLKPPERSRLYRALIGGSVPDNPEILNRLQNPAMGPSTTGTLVRSIRDRLQGKAVPIAHPRLIDWQNTAVLTILNPLAFAHAAAIPQKVVMADRATWFSVISPDQKRRHGKVIANHAVVSEIADIFHEAFTKGNEVLPISLASYLQSLFVETATLCSCHIDNILKNRCYLPKHLWTGSGGNIWDRLLRYSVRRNGGIVTGHDHGPGAGYRMPNTKALGDYVSCDRFVTYTDAQVEGLKKGDKRSFSPDSAMPRIYTLRGIIEEDGGQSDSCALVWQPPKQHSPSRVSSKKKPTVMYLAYGYDGERTRPLPKPSMQISLDWQQRLLSQLRGWEYDVLFKHHPDYHVAPEILQKLLNVSVIGGYLEQEIDKADYLILEWPVSSAICTAVRSDKPIIFIDFGFVEILSDAREMLAKRVAIVSGSFDNTGRAALDWVALREAFAKAPDLNDSSFSDAYFGKELCKTH